MLLSSPDLIASQPRAFYDPLWNAGAVPVPREQRKLAAILAGDVVGYSRLMGRDEAGTLARLRKNRSERLDPVLAKYGGRLVKLTGDGALVEFASAVDALSAAIEFQQAMVEANCDQAADTALMFRLGLHLGDLIVDGDDLYGDAVNVATRLEGEAPAGGILISRNVRDAVVGRVKATLEDLGGLSLKNIERPVRAFRVHWEASAWRPPADSQVTVASEVTSQSFPTLLPLPDKPSIAVLPFQNLSDDPGQDHFADGMVEEITTALARTRWLSVIARNSSFAYRGRNIDVREVGRELGVRYLLEGSVRKSGDRVRITGQLIDAASGAHLWADHFDGHLHDVFDLEDRVTSSVIGAIEPTLIQAELKRSQSKPAATAYDYLGQGMAKQLLFNAKANAEALELFRRSIAIDPDFAMAHAFASGHYMWGKSFGWLTDPASDIREGVRLARRALELGRDEPAILTMVGFGIAYLAGDVETGKAAIDRALFLDPNLASAWGLSCWIRVYLGEPELGVLYAEHAMQLSPTDIFLFVWQTARGYANFSCDRFGEARDWSEKALRERPGYLPAERMVAAAAALAGQTEQAQSAMARLRELDPRLRISNLNDQIPYRRPEDLARFAAGLREAGVRG
jgi:adenylate cyclase